MAEIEEDQKTPAASREMDLDPRVLDALGQRELIGRCMRKFLIEGYGALLAAKLQESIIHCEHGEDSQSRALVKFNNDPSAVHCRADITEMMNYLVKGEYSTFKKCLDKKEKVVEQID